MASTAGAAGAVRWADLSQVAATGMLPMEGWLVAPPMGMPSMEGSPAMSPTGMPPMGAAPQLGAKGTVGGRATSCCDDAPNAERPTEAQDPYHRLGKGSEEETGPEEEEAFNSGGLCFNADKKFFIVVKHGSSQLWHRGRHP